MSEQPSFQLILYVEGKGDEAFLNILIPRLTDILFDIRPLDNISQLINRVAYRMDVDKKHCPRFIVLCDKDKADCVQLKQKITTKLQQKSIDPDMYNIVIACYAMESFFLGDLAAVEKAKNITGLAAFQQEDPDSKAKPKDRIKQLLKDFGSYYGGWRDAENIAAHINITGGNRSASFNHLCNTIRAAA